LYPRVPGGHYGDRGKVFIFSRFSVDLDSYHWKMVLPGGAAATVPVTGWRTRAMISENMLREMVSVAKAACRRAYCPYSKFNVGAAVLTAEGQIVSGCNIENASYGLTICAERTAIFQAVARGNFVLRGIVVYTPTPGPTAPCGACRQVMNEFGPEADVVCVCDGLGTITTTVRELLPKAFGPGNLAW
jgi:cytidine deaminase